MFSIYSSNMKNHKLYPLIIVIAVFLQSGCNTYDIDIHGIPKFVNHDFIELSKVKRISRFRSGAGHSYTDSYEKCRSMKHYFSLTEMSGLPVTDSSNVYSPVKGSIIKVLNENSGNGVQLWIQPENYKAFTLAIFHIVTTENFSVGTKVTEGAFLGKTVSTDIAVMVNQALGYRNISYFEVMTDALFTTYQNRGVVSIEDMIISKETRDANPCQCDGESFLTSETESDWKILN